MEDAGSRVDTHDAVTLAQQPVNGDSLHDFYAPSAGRARKAGRHQIGVCKARFRLEADQGGIF